MNQVEITFERENRDGIVPVGTYLGDAAKRLGVRFEPECEPAKGVHSCVVEVVEGAEQLSALTHIETEHFADGVRRNGERLACQARIDSAGEIIVMSKEKAEEPKADNTRNPIQEEFAGLPLEKKIANLVKMEAATIGETISFVINSPFEVFQKVGDVFAEFGMRLETEAKKAARPEEHAASVEPEAADTAVDHEDVQATEEDTVPEEPAVAAETTVDGEDEQSGSTATEPVEEPKSENGSTKETGPKKG